MSNSLSGINDTLFITTEMNRQKETYRWSPPENLETRFGVEVEACIKTARGCLNFDGEALNQLNYLDLIPGFNTFKFKFDLYYKNIIQKSKYFEELAEKYHYLVIISKERNDTVNYYYDMENPDMPGLRYDQLLERKYEEYGTAVGDIYHPYQQIAREEVQMIVDKGINYEIPTFADDVSILCGDTKNMLVKEKEKVSPNSFRFECITPILSIKGYPTKEKIYKELYPLLSLFGLDKPRCFIQNYSMGFHVNASLYDTKRDKYIAIANPPFLNTLLRNYINAERHIYKSVRTRKPSNAEMNYISDYARPLYQNLNTFKKVPLERLNEINEFDKASIIRLGPQAENITNEDTIINTIMTKKEYMGFKYKGLKRKSPFLLEFRLFEGDIEINRLVNHVFTALDILHKSANEVSRRAPLAIAQKNNNGNNSNNNNVNVNAIGGGKRKTRRKIMSRRTRKK
jgi:hypothetical protein